MLSSSIAGDPKDRKPLRITGTTPGTRRCPERVVGAGGGSGMSTAEGMTEGMTDVRVLLGVFRGSNILIIGGDALFVPGDFTDGTDGGFFAAVCFSLHVPFFEPGHRPVRANVAHRISLTLWAKPQLGYLHFSPRRHSAVFHMALSANDIVLQKKDKNMKCYQ
eukprot:PhM_4_TR12646/c0_g1_i1/m.97056